MYQDSISALLGTGQDPKEQQLAQALRGQQAGGDMLSMSTIGSVSNLGQNINARTNAAAKQGGQLKQASAKMRADQARVAEANTARITAAELANTQRKDAAGLIQDERQAAKVLALSNRRENKEAANMERRVLQGVSLNGGQGRVAEPSPEQAALYERYDGLVGDNKKAMAKMPSATAVKEFEASFNQSKILNDVLKTWNPKYANAQEIPWGGDVLRFTAAKANLLTIEEQEEAAAWWANFDRQFTLEARNALFGGALTSGEEASWERSNINANMNASQMEMAMDSMLDAAVAKGEREIKLGATKGYPELWMLQNMEGVLDDPLGRNTAVDIPEGGLPEGATQKGGRFFDADGEELFYTPDPSAVTVPMPPELPVSKDQETINNYGNRGY